MTVHVNKAATRDMVEIALYSAEQWGEEQAIEYVGDLYEAIGAINLMPTQLGRPCHELPGLVWRRLCREHVIYYRVRGQLVTILRVLHKRRLPARHF